MKELKRVYAWLCILSLILGSSCIWLAAFDFIVVALRILFFILAIVFVAISFLIKHHFLRCPNCGTRGLSPQIIKNKSKRCPKCKEWIYWT